MSNESTAIDRYSGESDGSKKFNKNMTERLSDSIALQLLQALSSPSIVGVGSEDEYLDRLVPLITNACSNRQEDVLVAHLSRFSLQKETEIAELSSGSHQDFVESIQQLPQVQDGTADLKVRIMEINSQIQSSGQLLAEKKQRLQESKRVRKNIDDAISSLRKCLRVLALANKVNDLSATKKHFAALRTIDELQTVHLKEVIQFGFADTIHQSISDMEKMVRDAVITDLRLWLSKVRENSRLVGIAMFEHMRRRRARWHERQEADPRLKSAKINSAIEVAFDESVECMCND